MSPVPHEFSQSLPQVLQGLHLRLTWLRLHLNCRAVALGRAEGWLWERQLKRQITWPEHICRVKNLSEYFQLHSFQMGPWRTHRWLKAIYLCFSGWEREQSCLREPDPQGWPILPQKNQTSIKPGSPPPATIGLATTAKSKISNS